MSQTYFVLSEGNIEEMAKLTGKTKDELQKMLTECQNFGQAQVFWREFGRWFGIRLSEEVVYKCGLSNVMSEVFRRSGGY